MSWGGRGPAYRLLPDELTFATPVEISFSLEDSLLEGTDTVYVDVARQNSAGVWGVLKNRSIDWDTRTLTCTASHLSDYALVASVQILPAKAVVLRNGYQWLVGRVCSRAPAPSDDPDVASLVVECREDYASLASFTNWSVNGMVGNAAVGRVEPESGGRVRYIAPTIAPYPEQVTVSVDANFQGSHARLASRMILWDTESWEGEITATYTNGDEARSVLMWAFLAEYHGLELYKPVGRIEYTLDPGNCSLVSLEPDDAELLGMEGSMTIIDNSVDPPSVNMDFATSWISEHCFQCPEVPVECDQIPVNPVYHVADVVKGTNHDTIEATGRVAGGVTYTYSFRKIPRPTR